MTFSWGLGKLGAGFAHLGSGGGVSTPPVAAITLSSATIPDTTTSGTLVGTLAVVNNVSGSYTYSFLSNPGTLFAIVGSNLNTAAAVTVGVKPITIRAAGGVPTPIDQAFAITVTGTAPLNSVVPTISGTPAVSNTLTKATDGTWSGSPTIIFTYQWNRDGVAISPPQTGTSYNVVAADFGHVLSLTVIGTNSIGSSSATSANTTSVTGDSVPNAFTFTDAANQPLSTIVESNAITVAGINIPATTTITGGEYSINSGSYASTSTTVVVGDSVKVRGTSSGSVATAINVVLTIGGVSDTFTITTIAADTTPDAFTFTDVIDQPISTVIASNTITVTGINAAATMTVTGGEYSKNGGAFASTSTTVVVNDTVQVRGTSSGSNSTATNVTLTIGGVSDTFTITTIAAAADTTPDAFTFIDQTNVAFSTVIESNTITVTGINATTTMTIVGGEYSKNSGAFASTSTTVVVNDTVKVHGTSAGTSATPVDVTLTIGGVSDTFTITTLTATAPINTVAPVISGSKPFGSLLTVTSDGTWTGTPPITFDYQWKRGGTVLGVGPTYTTLITDVGFNVFCLVSGTNVAGANGGISNFIGVTNNFTAVRVSHSQW